MYIQNLTTFPLLPRMPDLSFPRVQELGSIVDVDATSFLSEEVMRLQKFRASGEFKRLRAYAESADGKYLQSLVGSPEGKRLQSEASRFRRLLADNPRAGALRLQEAHS